jgi:microcystin-dependent protein
MAYPPTPPSNSRVNTTPQVDAHPADHNALSNAITDIVNELGTNPSGTSTDVGARFDSLLPTGCMMHYAGNSSPSGWILCDGTARSKSDSLYAPLFAIIGYTFGGAGDSFNPPDLRDKMLVGLSGTKTLGSTGGSADSILPVHDHPAGTLSASADGDHQHNTYVRNLEGNYVIPDGSGGGAVQLSGPGTSIDYSKPTPAGQGTHAHTLSGDTDPEGVSPTGTNLPPYIAVYTIIKL